MLSRCALWSVTHRHRVDSLWRTVFAAGSKAGIVHPRPIFEAAQTETEPARKALELVA